MEKLHFCITNWLIDCCLMSSSRISAKFMTTTIFLKVNQQTKLKELKKTYVLKFLHANVLLQKRYQPCIIVFAIISNIFCSSIWSICLGSFIKTCLACRVPNKTSASYAGFFFIKTLSHLQGSFIKILSRLLTVNKIYAI